MLDNEINLESENNANQGFNNFCSSIFDLTGLVDSLCADNPDFMKPLERFVGVDFLRDEKWRIMGHNCVYERNNHYFYYTLPIYAHLLDEIKYKDANVQEVEVKPKAEKESSFNKFLYNPLVIFATSVLSIINVLNILPLYKFGIVMPAALGGAIPLYGHVILLLSSVMYSLPIINQKINNDFSNIIDRCHVEIEKNEYKAASSILHNMPLLNRWTLHKRLPYFTIDKHLKAKFYYYGAILSEKGWPYRKTWYMEDCLDVAYEYAEEPKLKFLILVKKLNIYDSRLLHYEEEFKKCKTTNETWLKMRSAHEKNIASCKRDIKKIMDELPDLPDLHRAKCENYVTLLKNCFNYLTSLDKEKRAQGIKQFDALEHEGYYRYYLPEATIVYYQLDLLICFFREDKNNYIGFISNVDKHMKKASKYINEYLPQLTEDYNTYIAEFKKICFEIDNAYKSPPQYTPALRGGEVKENISTLTATIDIEVIDENTPLLNDAKDNEKTLTYRVSLTPTL